MPMVFFRSGRIAGAGRPQRAHVYVHAWSMRRMHGTLRTCLERHVSDPNCETLKKSSRSM